MARYVATGFSPWRASGLQVQDFAAKARFVEHLPTGLLLTFQGQGAGAISSELIINLDVFEMLVRLNEGYRPSVEEMQGFYLCLGVFKNSLNAQPYREILLTTRATISIDWPGMTMAALRCVCCNACLAKKKPQKRRQGELMALQKKDREFRLPKDQLSRLQDHRDGSGTDRLVRAAGAWWLSRAYFRDKRELTVDKFVDDILEASHKFIGLHSTGTSSSAGWKPT
jgi:hypothetical protein